MYEQISRIRIKLSNDIIILAAGLGGHYAQGAELVGHAVQGYDGQGAGGYEHGSAGYEQAAAGYGQDAGYGHESAGYGQEAVAYAQDNAGYDHEGAAAAYEQAAGADQGHHYHHWSMLNEYFKCLLLSTNDSNNSRFLRIM